MMMTVPELAADALGKFLAEYMQRRFGSAQTHLVEMVPSMARIAIAPGWVGILDFQTRFPSALTV